MSKIFCPIPWIHTSIYNNGDFRVCCQNCLAPDNGLIRNEKGRVYNCRTDSISEVRNAKLPKEIRRSLLDGERHPDCLSCWQEEDSGITSRRQHEINRWNKVFNFEQAEAITEKDGAVPNDFPVHYWDIRFGNKCNLKCRMCWPGDSHLWYQDYPEFDSPQLPVNDMSIQLKKTSSGAWVAENDPFLWHEETFFWSELEKNAKNIHRIYIAGGEPLLIKRHFNFLNDLIEKGWAKNIELEYATNMTILPPMAESIWRNFKSITLSLSIDAIERVNDYVRYPAKWDVIKSNIESLEAFNGNYNIYMNATIGILNIYYLPELIDWTMQRMRNGSEINLIGHLLVYPHYLSANVLPISAKKVVTERIQSAIFKWESEFKNNFKFKLMKDSLEGSVNYMNSSDESHLLPEFIDRTKRLDSLRDTKFNEELPELFELLSTSKDLSEAKL